MKCNLCGFEQALQLITSTLCVNPECKNYDAAWSEEKGYAVFNTEKLALQDLICTTTTSSNCYIITYSGIKAQVFIP